MRLPLSLFCVFFNKNMLKSLLAHFIQMATRSNLPSEHCKATQEALLAQKKNPLDVSDDCPICRDDYQVLCRVACHPTTATGNVFFPPSFTLIFF